MGHQSDPSSSCCLCLRPHPPCVSDEQTAVDGAAQTRPALTDGASSSPAGEMDERHGLVGAGPWTGDSGGGQWRARSRSTRAILFSIHFTLASRSGGSDPGRRRQPRPQHACAARSGTHTARLDAGAATTTRISRAGTTSPGERERRRERAPVRKGTSPVGLAVAFAMAPLTSRKG